MAGMPIGVFKEVFEIVERGTVGLNKAGQARRVPEVWGLAGERSRIDGLDGIQKNLEALGSRDHGRDVDGCVDPQIGVIFGFDIVKIQPCQEGEGEESQGETDEGSPGEAGVACGFPPLRCPINLRKLFLKE